MIQHIMVCPFHEEILSCLQGNTVVVRISSLDEISSVVSCIRQFNNNLHCILLHEKFSLSEIQLRDDLKDIPLALHVTDIGAFPEFVKKLPVMRQLNLRVYLEGNYINHRILSSLGIASAVVFGEKSPDWEALCDLMTYAILGKVPHAPIEPFHYVAQHYDPHHQTDFSSVYFNNPSRYLHVNKECLVALTHDDLTAGRFIDDDVRRINDIQQCPAYIEWFEARKQYFLKTDGCAYCQGWRVCLGKFSMICNDSGCKNFFKEFMEIVEQYQLIVKNKKELWQP